MYLSPLGARQMSPAARSLAVILLTSATLFYAPTTAHAGDFWDEVREPGLRAFRLATTRAQSALTSHRFSVALASADQAIALIPDRGLPHAIRAQALGETGRHAESAAAYHRALSLDEDVLDDLTLGARAGELLARAGDLELAATILSDVADRMPRSPTRRLTFTLYADVLLARGPEHLQDAIRAFRYAMRDSPIVDTRAHLGLALALLRQGEREHALELARRVAGSGRLATVLSSLPLPEGEQMARRALALEAIGDPTGARESWERAATGPWEAHARSMLTPTRARRRGRRAR